MILDKGNIVFDWSYNNPSQCFLNNEASDELCSLLQYIFREQCDEDDVINLITDYKDDYVLSQDHIGFYLAKDMFEYDEYNLEDYEILVIQDYITRGAEWEGLITTLPLVVVNDIASNRLYTFTLDCRYFKNV